MKKALDFKFTETHQWLRVIGVNEALVGITDHAQESLGDIIYLDLPIVGTMLRQGEQIGVVESVKTASEIYTPISGKVLDANTRLADEPELINDDPYEAWILKIEFKNVDEIKSLMNRAEYDSFLLSL